jgi:hypothetical protein
MGNAPGRASDDRGRVSQAKKRILVEIGLAEP